MKRRHFIKTLCVAPVVALGLNSCCKVEKAKKYPVLAVNLNDSYLERDDITTYCKEDIITTNAIYQWNEEQGYWKIIATI